MNWNRNIEQKIGCHWISNFRYVQGSMKTLLLLFLWFWWRISMVSATSLNFSDLNFPRWQLKKELIKFVFTFLWLYILKFAINFNFKTKPANQTRGCHFGHPRWNLASLLKHETSSQSYVSKLSKSCH